MDIEELEPSNLALSGCDVESMQSWADRNGVTYWTVRGWAMKGVLPTVKIGKLRLINCVKFRQWLLEQE